MSINFKKILLSTAIAGFMLSSATAFAGNFDINTAVSNDEPCPVNAAYPGKTSLEGYPLSDYSTDVVIDAEFGAGAQAITQCLKERKKVKLVVRVNDTFRTDAFGQPRFNMAMYLSNIDKFINQYENTHGLSFKTDVDVRVVMGGSGAALATTMHPIFMGAAKKFNAAQEAAGNAARLDENPINPYINVIKDAMDRGIKFYLCQEASRTLGIKMANKIPGINFVPAAHAATADFQMDGYAILIP